MFKHYLLVGLESVHASAQNNRQINDTYLHIGCIDRYACTWCSDRGCPMRLKSFQAICITIVNTHVAYGPGLGLPCCANHYVALVQPCSTLFGSVTSAFEERRVLSAHWTIGREWPGHPTCLCMHSTALCDLLASDLQLHHRRVSDARYEYMRTAVCGCWCVQGVSIHSWSVFMHPCMYLCRQEYRVFM